MSAPIESNILQRPRRCKALASLVLLEKEDPNASESDYDDDDPKDLTYNPLVSQTETPQRRVVKKKRRDPGLKDRANAEAEPPDTCVLTGEKNVCCRVQAAHGMARNISYRRPTLMTHLEYHLGFTAPETFCLDTRKNIWFVNASDHNGADHGGFGTLPLLPDLLTVCDTAGDNAELPVDKRVRYDDKWKPTGGSRSWIYNHLSFLYTADTAPIILHRHPVPDSNGERPTTEYRFPYRNLRFKASLHIVFAIVDSWLKYDKYGEQDFWDGNERARINVIRRIMSIWLQDPPAEFLELAPATKAALAEAQALAAAEHDNDNDGVRFETPSRKPGTQVAGDLVNGDDLAYISQYDAKGVEDGVAPPAGPSKVNKGKGKAVNRDVPSSPTERTSRQPAVAGTHPSTSDSAVPDQGDDEPPAVAPGPSKPRKQKKAPPKASGAGSSQAKKRRRDRDASDDEYTEKPRPRKQAKPNGKRKPQKPVRDDEVGESEAGPSSGTQSRGTRKKAKR